MKKYFKFLLALPVFMAVMACTETVTLDNGVDQRVTKAINGYIDELSSAENGWIANVMTDEGIYRFWMDFTNNNVVTMYTDNLHHPGYQTAPQTSTYNIRSLMLPTLSFDTYSYIHIINDPDNRVSFGSDNQGLNTDFEFEIDRYEDGVFSLTGRINKIPATLTRATYDDKVAAQNGKLMSVLTETASYKKGQFCYVTVGDTKVSVQFKARKIILAYLDADGKAYQLSELTYTELDRNVIFNEPVVIAGVTITEFIWNEADQTYTAITSAGDKLVGVQDDPVVSLYKMFGGGKIYTTMFSDYYMYAEDGMTDEELAEIADKNIAFAYYNQVDYYLYNYFNAYLSYVAFDFYLTSTNRPRMTLTFAAYFMEQGGYAYLSYDYPLTFNDAKEQVTFGSPTAVDEDSAYLYDYVTGGYVGYLRNRVFKIEWSQVEFGSETMGQLRLIPAGTDKPATFYGALY